jgi:hypothetical protein
MRIIDRYPIIVTPKFRLPRFLVPAHRPKRIVRGELVRFARGRRSKRDVCLHESDHPSAPPGPETFSGTGMCFEIQVEDAAAAFAEFQHNGGAPAPGFWKRYMLDTEANAAVDPVDSRD